MIKKKIFAINLVLFLLVLHTIPALATFSNGNEEKYVQMASYNNQINRFDEKQEEKDAFLETAKEETGKLLFASSSYAYTISVNGKYFYSNEDAYGRGWSYSAADNMLTLNNYNGAGIKASGDLVIYAEGYNNVEGANGTYYGSNGIAVDGQLDLFINNGTTQINGGDGEYQGGDGISSGSIIHIFTNADTSLNVCAGYSSYERSIGGDGIYAYETVALYGDGDVSSTGGDGNNKNGYGGCAIISSNVYINSNCKLSGGCGYVGGPAIYFNQNCKVGIVNATFVGGNGLYNYPIQNSNNLYWYYNNHTTVSRSDTSNVITISINKYVLYLIGMGGTRETATFTSLYDYYPAQYDLSEYIFEKKGYKQVGWTATSGDLIPINSMYTPTELAILKAKWISFQPKDILLNSLSGKFTDGDIYKKYNTAINVPSYINFKNSNLLGWCDKVNTTANLKDNLFDGIWYRGNSTIEPSAKPIELYAHNDLGQYVIYHPTSGSTKNGGNILVQGTKSTGTNLQVYTLDSSYLNSPKWYSFVGWSTSANSNVVIYEQNELIMLQPKNVLNLYAVWEPNYYSKIIDEEIEVITIPIENKIEIKLTDDWIKKQDANIVIAGTYHNGRLLSKDIIFSKGRNVLKLEFPANENTTVKLFAWKNNLSPIHPVWNLGSIKELTS